MEIKIGDSIYVRSKGFISKVIAYVSSGGRTSNDIPAHDSRVLTIENNKVTLIEVMFTGKRTYLLDKYIKAGARVWIKRDTYLNDENIKSLLTHLKNMKVKRYDWSLIGGFLMRAILRKMFSRWSWDWVTRALDNKMAFVCSEFQNSGRRAIGMKVKENETPYDNFRKIPAEEVTKYNT